MIKATAIKAAGASAIACALCGAGLLFAAPGMFQANAIEGADPAIVQTVDGASPAASGIDLSATEGETNVTTLDQIVEAPAPAAEPAEGTEIIEDDAAPLAFPTEVAAEPVQDEAVEEPAATEQAAQPEKKAKAKAKTYDLVLEGGAEYMIDGEKYTYLGDSGTVKEGEMYVFESEDVSGDGWSLGSAELMMDGKELVKMDIRKL